MHLLLLSAAAAAADAGSGEISFGAALKANPYFLVGNMITSGIVLTFVVERFLFQLTRYRIDPKGFFSQVKKLVEAGNIDRAIKLCEANNSPILQLMKAGLTHANKGPDEIDAALSERLAELKPDLEKRVGTLWSLANIATLIGLLGTVSGLINTFAAVGRPGLSAADKQRVLSLGIAEAMYNTALGLGIAVFCMITHAILHARAKSYAHDLDQIYERTFNMLTITNKPGA